MHAVAARGPMQWAASTWPASFVRLFATNGSSTRTTTVQDQLFEVLFANDASILKDEAFGFTTKSLDVAADELGLSRACSGAISPAEIVHTFNRAKLADLKERLSKMDAPDTMHDGLNQGIRARLAILEPYQATWAGALAAISSPKELQPTLHHVEQLTTAILQHAGDIPAADMTWYTKRMLLGGILGAAEVQFAGGARGSDILSFCDAALRSTVL